jgi:hypothetical protein
MMAYNIYEPCPRAEAVSLVRAMFLICPNLAQSFHPSDLEKYQPTAHIPPELKIDRLSDPSYVKPRRLFYGFGLHIQDFIDYHQKHYLPPPHLLDSRAALWDHMISQVMADLTEACERNLRLILPISLEYRLVICLYESHNGSVPFTKMGEYEEQEVLEILRGRFGVVLDIQEPRWFFGFVEV